MNRMRYNFSWEKNNKNKKKKPKTENQVNHFNWPFCWQTEYLFSVLMAMQFWPVTTQPQSFESNKNINMQTYNSRYEWLHKVYQKMMIHMNW